jgi:hypothetical protein
LFNWAYPNSAKDSEESWGCIWKAPSWSATPKPWCTHPIALLAPLDDYSALMCDLVMSRLVLGVYHILFILVGFRSQDFKLNWYQLDLGILFKFEILGTKSKYHYCKEKKKTLCTGSNTGFETFIPTCSQYW